MEIGFRVIRETGNFKRINRGIVSQAGLTLLEVAIALSIIMLIFVAVGTILSTQADAVDNGVQRLLAESECDRARLALFNDLQTTNTLQSDKLGNPYFKIEDTGLGPNTKVVFRCVDGFDVDPGSDTVVARYGSPVTYSVNGNNQLIRNQDGKDKVVANRVSLCEFSKSIDGTIGFHVVTFVGKDAKKIESENKMSITPKNGYDR